MLKTPDFDAPYDPIVTESKGMLKTPDFDANQSNLLMNVVIIYKYGNDSASLHRLITLPMCSNFSHLLLTDRLGSV